MHLESPPEPPPPRVRTLEPLCYDSLQRRFVGQKVFLVGVCKNVECLAHHTAVPLPPGECDFGDEDFQCLDCQALFNPTEIHTLPGGIWTLRRTYIFQNQQHKDTLDHMMADSIENLAPPGATLKKCVISTHL